MYMEYARKSVKSQRKEYARRVKSLWENREAKRKTQQEMAVQRQEKSKVWTEKVYADVSQKCRGIWLTENVVDSKLQGISEKEATKMLQS